MYKPDFSKISKENKIKFIAFVVVLIILFIIGMALIPYFSALGSDEGRQALVADIQSKGPLGILIIEFMQVLQVVVAFIPGEVVQIISGVIYGTIGGLIICIVGLIISSALVYKLVDKLGMPFVHSMISPKMAKRLDFLQNNKKLDLIVFVLFFIPGLPKDIFTYFMPLTEMPLKRFLAISVTARIPGLIASTYMGSALLSGNYVGVIIIFVIFGGLGLVGIIKREAILDFFAEKKEEAREKLHHLSGDLHHDKTRQQRRLKGKRYIHRFEEHAGQSTTPPGGGSHTRRRPTRRRGSDEPPTPEERGHVDDSRSYGGGDDDDWDW